MEGEEIVDCYVRGETIRAWEALRLQDRQRSRKAREAVVRMFVERATHNFERLVENLSGVGYRFCAERPFARRVGPRDRSQDRALAPRMPLLMREWYCRIERVDLRQDPEQMYDDQSHLISLGYCATAVMLPFDEGRRMAEEEELTPMDYDSEPPRPARDSAFVCLGAFASNCDAIGYWVESVPFDPIIFDDGAGPVTMADHIRHIFEWGGFPLWKHMILTPERAPVLEAHPDFPKLLPALRRGLVAL